MSGWYSWNDGDLILLLKVQPGSRRDEFVDVLQQRLRVRIAAPPVDDRANTRLCAWLASEFGVARSAVRIERGGNGRLKRIRIVEPARLPSPVRDWLAP